MNGADQYTVARVSHILLGEQAWFQRIAGETLDRDIWRAMSIAQLREMHQTHERTYERLLGSDLDRIVSYQRFTGEKYQSSVSDIVLHLVTHGAHHRGQVAAHVAANGRPASEHRLRAVLHRERTVKLCVSVPLWPVTATPRALRRVRVRGT